MWVYLGVKPVPTLLDSGATCNAIPEGVACFIVSLACWLPAQGMDPNLALYPITRIEKYTVVAPVVGVFAQRPEMGTRFAIILGVEFVPLNKSSGDHGNPFRDIYLKVFPNGTANVPGLLQGNPTLDTPPFDLGHAHKEYTHFLQDMNVHLPRSEWQRRSGQRELMTEWIKQEVGSGSKGADVIRMTTEQCQTLSYAANEAAGVVAFYDGPAFSLQPGEQAMVPAVPLVELSESHTRSQAVTGVSFEATLL